MEDDEPFDEKPKKPAQGATFELTWQLFKSGMDKEAIAKERGMAVSTIEGHLARFVKTSEIALDGLMEPDKIEKITHYFINAETQRLGGANVALGYEISFSDLRFVLNHMICKGLIGEERQ
ncbi:MAG: helix-turn-helix domain-containing protein [Lentimicrobium sp.]|jgi:uncharacterized protein YpbB|nr:helix-turn-helix domain-containing protein [Bacteroidales bacterium]MDY0343400.1 helix-turn-helix domain-containing protein [Lentimicrobium sp.]